MAVYPKPLEPQPAAPFDPDAPPTQAEIDYASRPAVPTRNRRGAVDGFQNMPPRSSALPFVPNKGQSPALYPVPSVSLRAPAAMTPNPNMGPPDGRLVGPPEQPAAPPATAIPARPAESPLDLPQMQDYMSKPPETQFDDQLEMSQLMYKMYASLGMPDRAMAMQDRYAQTYAARYQASADQAIRSMASGDLSGAVDFFNHEVPNGRKIVAYGRGKDGKVAVRFEDGKTDTLTDEQIGSALVAMRNPAFLESAMQTRIKAAAEGRAKMGVETLKHQFDLEKAVANGMIDLQTKLRLKQFEMDNNLEVTVVPADGVGGKPAMYARRGGSMYKIEEGKTPDGKLTFQTVGPALPIPAGTTSAAPSAGAANPFAVNPIFTRGQ